VDPAGDALDRELLDIKKAFNRLVERLDGLPPGLRDKVQGSFTQRLFDRPVLVDTPRGMLSFVALGKIAAGRANAVLTKQPATIAWIDAFAPGSVFWDIGANIGVYTLYAALREDVRVVACEPAAVNYFQLAANCEINGIDRRVDCLPIGVGRSAALARIGVSQFAPAASFKFQTADDAASPEQPAIVLSIDQLVQDFGLPCPNYLKIDTPGSTEAVIEGAARTLRRADVREVHIELREHSRSGQQLLATMADCGLTVGSRHPHGDSADLTLVRR
jgi:FkbM family methyltransferase